MNTDIVAVANINGWFTEYFNVEKGARQRDPIAPYLFVLCAELLGEVVRTHDTIHGFQDLSIC